MRGPAIAALCAILLTTLPADANGITFEIWPDTDPDATLSCAFRLAGGTMTLLEVRGPGMPAKPLRWFANAAERAALATALQALVGGTLASVTPAITTRAPAPPFITATWMARLDQGLASGLYIQPGLALPPELAAVLTTITPGGLCTRAIRLP